MEEQKWIQKFVQAANVAKAVGALPAGMERIMDDLTTPKINWKALLHRFLTETIKNDFNWRRPNRRYIQQGLYLPFRESPAMGDGVIMVDTSGSISRHDLQRAGSEIKGVTDAYNTNLTVIYIDADVAGVDHIDAWSPEFKLYPKGGGGTSFVPGFEYVEENQIKPAFAVYITDGYSYEYPEYPPPYPFIWVLTEEYKEFKPPFGEVITLPKERRAA